MAHTTYFHKLPGQLSLDQTSYPVVVTNTSGAVVYANDAAIVRTGFSATDISGKKPGDLWGGHMAHVYYEHMWKLLNRSRPFVSTLKNIHKSGVAYTERVHIARVFSREKKNDFFFEISLPQAIRRETAPEFDKKFVKLFSSEKPITVNNFFSQLLSAPLTTSTTDDTWLSDMLIAQAKHFTVIVTRKNDAALIETSQKNHEQFGRLYIKYRSTVLAYFRRRFGYSELVEDLTEETFLNAFTHVDQFKTEQALYRTYLLRIAHNLYVSYLRKYHDTVPLDDVAYKLTDAHHDSFLGTPIEDLQEIVHTLSTIDCTIIHEKYIEGFSIREIAQHVALSENAVKLRLSRARKKLAGQLHDRGITAQV